jgi:hypothetical protein
MNKKLIIGWCIAFVIYMALWWLQYDNKGIVHTNEKGIDRSILIAQLKIQGLYKELNALFLTPPVKANAPYENKISIIYVGDAMSDKEALLLDSVMTDMIEHPERYSFKIYDDLFTGTMADTIPIYEYYVDCDTIKLEGDNK